MSVQPHNVPVNVFRVTPHAKLPTKATEFSACFDLYADLSGGTERPITVYSSTNAKSLTYGMPSRHTTNPDLKNIDSYEIQINPGDRVLVPTGLIFRLDPYESLRIYARSGLVLKQGLCVANGEGIVDADYVDPVFVIITNISRVVATITHGMRIAQMEVVNNVSKIRDIYISEIPHAPQPMTERQGGFGSTGTH